MYKFKAIKYEQVEHLYTEKDFPTIYDEISYKDMKHWLDHTALFTPDTPEFRGFFSVEIDNVSVNQTVKLMEDLTLNRDNEIVGSGFNVEIHGFFLNKKQSMTLMKDILILNQVGPVITTVFDIPECKHIVRALRMIGFKEINFFDDCYTIKGELHGLTQLQRG